MNTQDRDDDNPANAWMWFGKLAPPHTQLETVPRDALLADMRAHATCPLALLVSAPGFGKTTLLSQWRRALLQASDSACVAWLSLDEADAEVNRFLAYMLLALEEAGLDIGGLSPLARSQRLDEQPQRTVAALLQVLARHGQPVTLILDDYHRAECAAVDEALLTLLERGGRWLRLVVSSRNRPSWPLAALRARGLVHELDAASLTLSMAEASQIFGAALEGSALATLHAKTEGWAVALQLARLWLARGSGSAFGLPSFSGRVSEVAEYLAEQIVDNLPADCREFLLETSLLERFNADLADVARGRDDSARLLARLSQFDALLVPLDPGRSWFRYHLLLADFLRARLPAARAREIHRAAAVWLARNDDLVKAVSHALAGDDTALALRLVVDAGGWELVLRKGIRYTENLLSQFDELATRAEPELTLMHAYLQAKLGKEALALELLRLAQVAAQDTPALRRDYGAIEAMVHVYFDVFDDYERWPVTGNAAQQRNPDDPLAQGMQLCARAVGSLAWGRMDDVVQAARAARVQMQLIASPLGENYCLMHEALALAMTGQMACSRQLLSEALRQAEANFGTDSSLKGIVGCFWAQHLYWQGEWKETPPWIRDGNATLEQTDGWLDVFASHAEVAWRTALRLEGLQPALSVLDDAARTGRERHLDRLLHLVQAWRVDLLSQCGLAAQALQEARAADLESAAGHLPVPGLGWRRLEAVTLALARLALANGASAAAQARLEAAAGMFEQAGLMLPAWRFRLLALVARRKAQDGDVAPALVQAAMAPVVRFGLSGLLLETGPAILPFLPDANSEAGQSLGAAVSQLRGWQAHPVRRRAQFSAKEMQVLALLASGQSNKAIARGLDVSENTVKFHLKQIFQKFGVDNRAAAVSQAMQQGLLSP
ncbi:LuxR C-terminal-related transcriptional regulator [Cupriavidus numazuensis]|uniref:HTH-type transcriptional regulator MalT n=1 Tax=Cupriavidus numazuensis TaxID=221992 RepID=A0ABM8TF77_9BURK|nr:LuxR C-terminal-related transcriptional regulator [Cupriavidus numazuensis]CAG2141235.1 HTH-type transcriptional regulator MalT [Cupriavidus numazuensis]